MNLQKGQKIDITKNRNVTDITIHLGWKSENADMEIDGAAFLLSAAGRCERDSHLIFYGNPTSEDGAVSFSKLDQGDKEQISITFSKLAPDIQKIAVTLTIYEGEKSGHSFRSVSQIYARLSNGNGVAPLFKFEFGSELNQETAIVIGELYLHNGEWKFNAIGSGFNGGLSALCNNYGIEVLEDDDMVPVPQGIEALQTPEAPEPVKASTAPKLPITPDAPPVKPIVLEKIELKKQGSISIQKSSTVTALLQWDNPRKDLDLYCFYVTRNGETGKIYYRNLGSSSKSPFIQLDKDSKQGGTETITIHSTQELKYVLFAAYSAVSNGFGSFKSMKARAVVNNHAGQTVTASLAQNNKFAYWVAIAKIDFSNPNEMIVSQVETYSKGGSERSPLLYADGTFKMNVGPIEFK